jgi:hypothetical protein
MTDQQPAARERSRVALVTCAELPELDPDDRRLLAPLRARGIEPVPAVWDDPAVGWAGFDLVVLRSCWDYPPRRAEFLAWAAGVARLANPAELVGWNTDKRYLAELAATGLPVVPTSWLAAGETWTPPASGEWVVKPAVGVGSKGSGRYRMADPEHRRLAAAHVRRLQRAGRLVMVQPYLPAVDSYGETAVLFLADPARGEPVYSHAVRKGPMLAGPERDTPDLYLPERISRRAPSAAELALARQALALVPGGPGRLLYARVDLLPGQDGSPLLVELELTEPSLFLGHRPGAARQLAEAIAARLRLP